MPNGQTRIEEQQTAAQMRDIAAMNPENPAAPETVFPDNSNDKWLADSLAAMRSKSTEYAALASEQAREQWEQTARTNLLRQRAIEQQITERNQADIANRDAGDDRELRTLVEQSLLIMPKVLQYATPTAMPLALHRQWAKNEGELSNWAARKGLTQEQAVREMSRVAMELHGQTYTPAPDLGQPVTEDQLKNFGDIQRLPDGTYQVKLSTGELFRGSAEEVMREQAKAMVHTKRYAQQLKRQAGNPSAQLPAQPSNGNEPAESSFGEWAANEQARSLGFNNSQELMEWGVGVRQDLDEMKQMKEEYENHQIVSEFFMRAPDYPNTPEAEQAIVKVVENQGWEYTPDTLVAAHAFAVRNGMYQPLTVEQQQAAAGIEPPQTRRPTPPPMLPGSAPDSHGDPNANDPYLKPLAELRRDAIRQQLEQRY